MPEFRNLPEATPPDETLEGLRQLVVEHLYYSRGTAVQSASIRDLYAAVSRAVRDLLVYNRRQTTEAHYEANPKFVYYLSAEYLLGKQLPQNLLYTHTTDNFQKGLEASGFHLPQLLDLDTEPGLGNGGLGRLAACYMDSLATLNIPAVGYGIRYEFGIFQQTFRDGWQVEQPDDWLLYGNPWEFEQPDDMVEIGFYGHTEYQTDADGQSRLQWVPSEYVKGEPYTTLVPGYNTKTVNILRLWRARATAAFDFKLFDAGHYAQAVANKIYSENITKALYPNDTLPEGQELRLQQQYFFTACSLHDIIRRFRLRNSDWRTFPDKVVIQLNDTHPVIAIPELMRLLVDNEKLSWNEAWDITRRTFAYTCHTLLPEALEKWPVSLLGTLLPRHLEIIYEINKRFLDEVRNAFPGNDERVRELSIIEEGQQKQVRMANLACIGSFAINGVAELHSRLLRQYTLSGFYALWPEKFQNKTNGVSPRRFIKLANPALAQLITETIGEGWLTDLTQLRQLEPYADDREFQQKWWDIKQKNKEVLASYLAQTVDLKVSPQAMFDVLVKRLHEYKRQLLMLLHIIALYQRLKADPQAAVLPRLFLFGAKAAPGYFMAKRIIKLINNVAEVVNNDPDIHGRVQIAFPPNFNVTMAEKIYPAADVSEQISLAGKEASGTGNMKFALNGALTIGTLDGANIEIRERVGEENFFLFGLTVEEVEQVRQEGYDPYRYYESNETLKAAIDSISRGDFSGGDPELFRPIVDSLLYEDRFLLLADFDDYLRAQAALEEAYRDQTNWTRMSILNTAQCVGFLKHLDIGQYCDFIWNITA
ncbi:MAG: glycogen/starch/alpha-glucan phosphorylase [Anaerolineales bacterium]|nr:glycogen/starch/alpha-glucan phosphorylase [Anaerolineales bacterium]